MSRHLDIGCGNCPRNPYGCDELVGIDQSAAFNDVSIRRCQLGLEWVPFPDNYFESVSAFDVLEHIPRQSYDYANNKIRFPFIEAMQEVWRVLKKDGRFFALTPVYPAKQAFVDPTHVNIITDDTHKYFCGDDPPAGRYGYSGRFKPLQVKRVMPEEVYGETSFKSRWRQFRYRHLKRDLSHLVWELAAQK